MTDESSYAAPIRRAGLKATLLLVLTAGLVAGFVLYVLYARGTFEETQRLVLMAEDSEGVSVGADLTFSGFPVGRVQRIELSETGQARIEIDVPRKDARWLRASSVFTLERGLVGGARLRAFTARLDDAPLPDGAVRPVLRGDTTDELPALVSSLKRVLDNVDRMTSEASSLNQGLAALRVLAERMNGRYGALSGLLGSDEEAQKVIAAIERANALLGSLDSLAARLDAVSRKVEGTLERADDRVFGTDGLLDETRKAVAQLAVLLAEARESLRKADAVLGDAQRISANTRAATEDLAALRADVEASLRKASELIDEVNRKWPFRRDTELRLP